MIRYLYVRLTHTLRYLSIKWLKISLDIRLMMEQFNGDKLSMKSRSLSSIMLLALLLFVSDTFSSTHLYATDSQQSENEPIPYIYYYSHLEDGFVIERADGTDSRLLAQGVMSNEHNAVIDSLWSPSGEYLAWRSRFWFGPARNDVYNAHGWLVSSDGSYVSDLLSDAANVIHMEWMPGEDILAVIFNDEYTHNNQTVRLIDVPENQIIAEMNSHIAGIATPFYESNRTVWASDGSSVYILTGNEYTTIVNRLYLDGSSERWISSAFQPLSFSDERLFQRLPETVEDVTTYIGTVTDLTTGESRLYETISEDDVDNTVYEAVWNPTREYAIVDEGDAIVLFDWTGGERHVLEGIAAYLFEASVSIPSMRGDDRLWSNDGTAIMLTDDEGAFYLLDTVTQDMFPIDISGVEYWQWVDARDVLMVADDDDGVPRMFRYSASDGTTTVLDFVTFDGFARWLGFDVSPCGNFIEHIGTLELYVQNIETEETYRFPVPGIANHPGYPWTSGFQWHEDQQWFFSSTDYEALMIHHIDDAYGRDLTICYNVDDCAGFLPDRVLPYLSPGQELSLIPAPEQILLHEFPVWTFTWNEDGTKIASFSADYNNEFDPLISIWDITGETPVLEEEFVTRIDCVTLRDECSLIWLEEEDNYGMTLNPGAYQIMNTEDDEPLSYVIDSETEEVISDVPLEDFYTWVLPYIIYHPDTGLVVQYSAFQPGRIWDIHTGELLDELNWQGFEAQFNPDGTLLGVAHSRYVSIWDMTPYIEEANGN